MPDAAWIDKAMIYGPLGIFALLVVWGVREGWSAIWNVLFRQPSKDDKGTIDPGGWFVQFLAKQIETNDSLVANVERLTEMSERHDAKLDHHGEKLDRLLGGAACRNYSPVDVGGSGIHKGA